jgi:predicted nucleotidyltransferase
MRRDEVVARLKEIEPALRAQGVASLFLFGSYARDEATPESDVDVFVDPVSGEQFGFLPFMQAYETLRSAIGHGVELGYSTRDGLDRYVRARVEKEALKVF